MKKDNTDSGILPSGIETVRAMPHTVFAGVSTFLSSYLGFERFANEIPPFKGNMKGPSGEVYIADAPTFLTSEMEPIVKYWKSDERGENFNGERFRTNGEVLDHVEATTKKYGLKKETEAIRRIRDTLAKTEGMLEGKIDKTHRAELHKVWATESQGLPFMEFFQRPTETGLERTTKAYQRLREQTVQIQDFVKEHNAKIINRYRTPLVALLTGSAVAATAYTHISAQRREKSLERELAERPKLSVEDAEREGSAVEKSPDTVSLAS